MISTPKKKETVETVKEGHVEYFNPEKGYGFIKDSITTDKYFFHISNAPEAIGQGKKVTFELERGPKGIHAVKIAFTD